MKNKPSRKVIITNLTLLTLAIIFGLSIFFAAHFYAVPLLTLIGSWAIAHLGITGASLLAGALGIGSLLAISAESLQRGSVANFNKVLVGSVLNLVTLFAFRKQIQAKLGLDTDYRKSIVIGAGSRKDRILANTDTLKQDTKSLLSSVQLLSERLPHQPTSNLEQVASLPPSYAESATPTVTSSSSTSTAIPVVSSMPQKPLFTPVEPDKTDKGKEPIEPSVPTSTQIQSTSTR